MNHTCAICETTTDEWAERWSWYGSWKDLEDGPIYEPPAVVCSEVCRVEHARIHKLDPSLIDEPRPSRTWRASL